MLPWSDLWVAARSATRSIPKANIVQVATVSFDGFPRCRSLVLRGYASPDFSCVDNQERDPRFSALRMTTDARSEKCNDVKSKSVCELVWWVPFSGEQFRLRGRVQLVGEDVEENWLLQQRAAQWVELADAAREMFYWDVFKGNDPMAQVIVPKGGRDPHGTILPPPENFLLFLVWPTRCEYLRLADNYRQLDVLENDGIWSATKLTKGIGLAISDPVSEEQMPAV